MSVVDVEDHTKPESFLETHAKVASYMQVLNAAHTRREMKKNVVK
jgi:hypothetical protein